MQKAIIIYLIISVPSALYYLINAALEIKEQNKYPKWNWWGITLAFVGLIILWWLIPLSRFVRYITNTK